MVRIPFNSLKKISIPVLSPGPPGSWDEEVAANPRIFKQNGSFYNFYTGYSRNGTYWGIGQAISSDLIHWQKVNNSPLIQTGDSGTWHHANVDGAWVVKDAQDRWHLIHEGRRLFNTFETQSFGLVRLENGWKGGVRSWPFNPVFTPTGKAGDFDSTGLLAPLIYRINGSYWLFYSGFDGKKFSTGLAFSEDLLNWRRYQHNPIFRPGTQGSWDSHGAILLNFFRAGDLFYAFYEGMDFRGRLAAGLAASSNLICWQRVTRKPVIRGGGPGSFDEKKLCSPFNVIHDSKIYLFFGAHPAGERPGFTGLAVAELASWAKHAETCGQNIDISDRDNPCI